MSRECSHYLIGYYLNLLGLLKMGGGGEGGNCQNDSTHNFTGRGHVWDFFFLPEKIS